MPDAIASATAAPPAMSSKVLIERDVGPADEASGESFATLVDTLVPAAIPGADLPVDADALPADAALMFAVLGSGAPISSMPTDPAPDLPIAEDLSRLLPVLRPGTSRTLPGAPAVPPAAADGRAATEAEAEAADALSSGTWRADAPSDSAEGSDFGPAALAGETDLAALDTPDVTGPSPHAPGIGAERSALPEPAKLQLDSRLPVTTAQFVDRFAEQITVLVEHGVKHAQLSLNPAELGPLEVRITFHRDEATVQFASHHGAVRDAVTDALPKLRDMLGDAGVKLGDSGVFSQLPQRETAADGRAGNVPREQHAIAHDVLPETPTAVTRLTLGLVDAYV